MPIKYSLFNLFYKQYKLHKSLFQKYIFGQWIYLVCFFALVFLIIGTINEQIYIDIYTQRDIQRAKNWLKGDFFWAGPEMSSGSNLPGPFFYFLLFPPLIFGEGLYSQFFLWRALWLSLTYTTGFYFICKICKYKESSFIFIMFLISGIGTALFLPLWFAWNPSFSIMFHVLALISLYYWKETGKNIHLYLLGLIIGFGIQVHFLVSAHILTALLVFLFEKKKRLKPVLLFSTLILLPCLPYLLTHIFRVLKTSKSFQLSYINELIKMIASEAWFNNLHHITGFKLYLSGPLLFLILLISQKTIIPFLFEIFRFYRRGNTEKVKTNRYKKTFPFTKSTKTLLTITAFPIFIPILAAESEWYLYTLPLFFILIFSKMCDDLMPGGQRKRLNYLLIYSLLFALPVLNSFLDQDFHSHILLLTKSHILILLLILIILFGLSFPALSLHGKPQISNRIGITAKNLSYKTLWKILILLLCSHILLKKDYRRQKWDVTHTKAPVSYTFFKRNDKISAPNPIPQSFYSNYETYHAMEPLLKKIISETKWDAGAAIKRIYLIGGLDKEIALFSYYSLAKEELAKENLNRQTKPFDLKITGYLLIQHLKRFTGYTKTKWRQYLLHSPFVSDFIKREIRANKLIVKTPNLYNGRFWLIPYKTEKGSIFPKGFYNIGQPYYWEEPDWLKNCKSSKTFMDDTKLYYCMILPGHLQRAGVRIRFSGKTKQLMEMDFFGPLIGIKAESSNFDGYAFWSDISISLSCNGKTYLYSAPDIGYNPKSYYDFVSQAKTFNSPLALQIPIHCQTEKIGKIKLKFNHLKKFPYEPPTAPEEKEIVWQVF